MQAANKKKKRSGGGGQILTHLRRRHLHIDPTVKLVVLKKVGISRVGKSGCLTEFTWEMIDLRSMQNLQLMSEKVEKSFVQTFQVLKIQVIAKNGKEQ